MYFNSSFHNVSQTAESEGKTSVGKKLTADWVYNIGENIKSIQKIQVHKSFQIVRLV